MVTRGTNGIMNFTVRPIKKDNPQMKWLIWNRHYASIPTGYHPGFEPSKRLPQIVQAFGAFTDEMVGCCVFSRPASYTLCKGVCGEEHKQNVIELARLVVTTTEKNAASYLISQSLKQLEMKPWIVVSYADCNEGHVGYVYQATNWIYTGRGNPEPWWMHPKTNRIVSKTRRHIDVKAKQLNIDWKELIREKKLGKHRYVTFVGNRRQKREMLKALRYKVTDPPKGVTKRFDFDSHDERPLWSS